MTHIISDVGSELGYYRLLEASEKSRWTLSELRWDDIDKSKVTTELVEDIKVAAYGELTTFSATEAFMKLFHDDIDFSQWLAVWFYEETKHPLAFIKWLAKLGIPTDESLIRRGRKIAPMAGSKVEVLTSNICSEIVANTSYRLLEKSVTEPVLAEILRNVARDEMRHSNGFQFYCQKAISEAEDPERERLRALRVAWFLSQPLRDGVTQHPVFLTLPKMRHVDTAELERLLRERIADRIAKMLDLDIPGPDAMYDVYVQLRKDYRAAKRSVQALG
jgi:hypothetical protein